MFNGLPGDDRDDMKETLVSSFTGGRTTHLSEMTQKEYNAMCSSLEARTGWKERQKKARSVCLRLMQQLGIDTSDWSRVNAFCSDPRIAGKVFARLSVAELGVLSVKLRSILRKGGLVRARGVAHRSLPVFQDVRHVVVPLSGIGQA